MLETTLMRQLLNRIVPNGLTRTFQNGPLRGKTMCGPLFSGIRTYTTGNHEIACIHIIRKLSPFIPFGSFYDIGAHIGYYSLLIPSLLSQIQSVHSFEPHPRVLRFLKKNLTQKQNTSNFTIHPVAITSTCGRSLFWTIGSREAPQGSGLLETIPESHKTNNPDQAEFYVETATLDYLVYEKGLPVPSFIKIDAEGAEINVLLGAKKLIAEQNAIWFAEIHKGIDLYQFCSLLSGYQNYELLSNDVHTRVLSIPVKLITADMIYLLKSCLEEKTLAVICEVDAFR